LQPKRGALARDPIPDLGDRFLSHPDKAAQLLQQRDGNGTQFSNQMAPYRKRRIGPGLKADHLCDQKKLRKQEFASCLDQSRRAGIGVKVLCLREELSISQVMFVHDQ